VVIHLGEAISEQANIKYGEPPYGHAELSPLRDFAEKIKVELDESLALLAKVGVQVDNPEQTIQQLADANGLSPQEIYLIVKPSAEVMSTVMPEEAPGGTGKRTLAQICAMYKLNPIEIIQGLAAINITAELSQPMKDIAAANGVDPHAIYAEIYQLAKQK